MPLYFVSDGFVDVSYIDEVTLEEKSVKRPNYAFDAYAEGEHGMETVRLMCSVMGMGVEDKDFFIYEIDVEDEVIEEVEDEYYYPEYVLN